ncbi:hypothetical protein PVC88_004076 [Cronobacter sakazakii]|nr:hypothetical protein [Cronobacter sakazakii]
MKEKIKLNEYYQFLPGKHSCDFGTESVSFMRLQTFGEDYLSPESFFSIRSNRVIYEVDGDKLNDKLIEYYTVR